MKKAFLFLILFLVLSLPAFADETVLKGGVSLSNQVPKGFFGIWRIVSTQTYTNNRQLFTGESIDYWNLSRADDVITLSNPVSGALASVRVEEVNGNRVKFIRNSQSREEKVTETPVLTLDGENFYGTDKIVIEKYKFGELIRTDVVEYRIKARKISGNAANEIFTKK
jgi:hypothetical protein